MRGAKATLTLHCRNGHTVDAEGNWTQTWTDVTVEGGAHAYKRSEEPQTAHQDWERGRIVVLLYKDADVNLDDEITVANSYPNCMLDGRYKIRGVRHLALHTRVLCHILEEEDG